MKLFILFAILCIGLTGCDDSLPTSNRSGRFGEITGGGNNAVQIQVQGQVDQQTGRYNFDINPNVEILLANLLINNRTTNQQNNIPVNNARYQAGQFAPAFWLSINNIVKGTQLSITFSGTTANGNVPFTATTEYTVP